MMDVDEPKGTRRAKSITVEARRKYTTYPIHVVLGEQTLQNIYTFSANLGGYGKIKCSFLRELSDDDSNSSASTENREDSVAAYVTLHHETLQEGGFTLSAVYLRKVPGTENGPIQYETLPVQCWRELFKETRNEILDWDTEYKFIIAPSMTAFGRLAARGTGHGDGDRKRDTVIKLKVTIWEGITDRFHVEDNGNGKRLTLGSTNCLRLDPRYDRTGTLLELQRIKLLESGEDSDVHITAVRHMPDGQCKHCNDTAKGMRLNLGMLDLDLDPKKYTFEAHEHILKGAASPYFTNWLKRQWLDTAEKEHLSPFCARTMEIVMVFLYGGYIQKCDYIDYKSLYLASEYYGITPLMNQLCIH
ncbi:MAG: hypothetical protein CMJ95_10785 [Planctomycetes bacterium]|nr:hypothetical protein [Planctomycetota bacterium]